MQLLAIYFNWQYCCNVCN